MIFWELRSVFLYCILPRLNDFFKRVPSKYWNRTLLRDSLQLSLCLYSALLSDRLSHWWRNLTEQRTRSYALSLSLFLLPKSLSFLLERGESNHVNAVRGKMIGILTECQPNVLFAKESLERSQMNVWVTRASRSFVCVWTNERRMSKSDRRSPSIASSIA